MPTPTPQLKALTERLIKHESATALEDASFRVWEKMRIPLGRLFGLGGYHALICRSLILARREAASLGTLQVDSDGAFVALADWGQGRTPPEYHAAEVAVVTQLLVLLETFIGPALTRRLLRDTWPDFDLENS